MRASSVLGDMEPQRETPIAAGGFLCTHKRSTKSILHCRAYRAGAR